MSLFLTSPNGTIFQISIGNDGAMTQTVVAAGSVTDTPLTVAQIIELADRRTERRGRKYLDLTAELLFAVQEFCKEHHWFWRRKTASFYTVQGTPTYDLSSNAGGLPGITDFEQFCENGVRLYRSTSDYTNLDPIFNVELQDDAIEDTTQDQPEKYFIEPGTLLTMRLTAIPDGIYKMRTSYWSVPVTLTDPIPVPGHLHMIVVKALEKNILKFLEGDENPDYLSAQAQYDSMVAKANTVADFMRGRRREWRNGDPDAIQSH